jgi:hypothetical protein
MVNSAESCGSSHNLGSEFRGNYGSNWSSDLSTLGDYMETLLQNWSSFLGILDDLFFSFDSEGLGF